MSKLVITRTRKLITPIILFAAVMHHGTAQAQVLAQVGEQQITAKQLDETIASSPMAVQFPSMDEGDQAALRGELLKRMVAARLLYLEAKKRGLHQSKAYLNEAKTFRQGYLYRAYMEKLKAEIEVDPSKLEQLKETYKGEPDAMIAARSQEVSERYKLLKVMALQFLKEKYHLEVFEDKIAAGIPADEVIAKADSFTLRYGDIHPDGEAFNPSTFEDRLYSKVELLLVSKAAEEEGIEAPMEDFEQETLPSMLLAQMEKEWIPDEETLKRYFEEHPEIGRVAERRQITQIVTKTRKEAESLRKQILDGESMFRLAGEQSIDPYGAKHAGDMGWLNAGSGTPEIEKALEGLKDGELSEVIETAHGFHLVRIEAREFGRQMTFDAVRDRIRQALVNRNYPGFIAKLQQRYPIKWSLQMSSDEQRAQALMQQ